MYKCKRCGKITSDGYITIPNFDATKTYRRNVEQRKCTGKGCDGDIEYINEYALRIEKLRKSMNLK